MAEYSNTVWNEYTLDDVRIASNLIDYQGRKLTDIRLECANGPSVTHNTTLHTKLWSTERFVVAPTVLFDKNDEWELEKYFRRSNFPVKRQIQLASSFTWVLKTFPDKKIYLRTVAPTKNNEDRRVFASEVLEIIPILAERQKKVPKKLTYRLKAYKKKWTLSRGIKSISLEELQKVLEDFDINKQLITLVPDISFFNEITYRVHVAQGHSAVIAYGPDGGSYMDVTQSIFMLFLGTVAEVYWGARYECDKNPGSMDDFKEMIIRVMQHYSLMEEGTYLPTSFVEKTLTDLRSHDYYKERVTKPWTPILEFLYCDFNDKIEAHYLFAKFYNFEVDDSVSHDQALIPVWRARVLCLIRWAEVFFDNRHFPIEKIVMRGIGFKVPATKCDRDPAFPEMLLTHNRDVFEQEYLVSEMCAGDMRPFFTAHPLLLTYGYQNWDGMSHIVRADKWIIREQKEIDDDPSNLQEVMAALAHSQRKIVIWRENVERETLRAIEVLKEFLDVDVHVLASSEEETARVARQERNRNPRRRIELCEPPSSDRELQFPLEYYKRKTARCEKELANQKAMNRESTIGLIDRAIIAEQRVAELEEQLNSKTEKKDDRPDNEELIEKLEAAMLKLKNQLAEKDETIRTLLEILKTSP